MAETKAYALFDFDGTLSKGDSILPFLWYCFCHKQAGLKDLWRAANAWLDYALKIHGDTQAKALTMAFLKGKTAQEVEALSEKFYQDKLMKRIFPQGVWELQKCREEGLEILIITASPEIYLRVLKKRLGVSEVIGTGCETDADGVYTGRLSTPNCRGDEKPRRVRAYLRANEQELDEANSRAYGNSTGDLPMLAMAAQPVVVNGSQRLKAALPQARQAQWK